MLRLGVMGLSEGNGHPYSWSAICNGYDPTVMQSCPFPTIPEYLARQTFPDDALEGARVTHVWTQDRQLSEHVAAAALVSHVVDDYEAMIGQVDGVLLARDDAERHVEMSLPFLAAGVPIYIDKPIATTLTDLNTLFGRQKYVGQIFSCSALRYSDSLQLDEAARQKLGEIRHVDAIAPKSWEKYGVHLLDPVMQILGLYGQPCTVKGVEQEGVQVVTVQWNSLSATFSCVGNLPAEIRLRFHGSLGTTTERVFNDSFASFKRALEQFVACVSQRREVTTRTELESVVSILERGAAFHVR